MKPGTTLALVGGDVTLEGGDLTALGGRIDLGSVAGNSLVSLTPTNQGWALGYEGMPNFQNIQLSQGATVDASGAGGTINVQGQRVTLTGGSQILNNTLGAEPGGVLAVAASESVQLIGTAPTGTAFPSGLFSQVDSEATGSGGRLLIGTRRLIIQDGGGASAGSTGKGRGGSLEVNASESVALIGTGPTKPSFLTTATNNIGAGGNLIINTKRLTVRGGAQIRASTLSESKGGTLTVNASESVEVIGTGIAPGNNTQFSSALLATSGIENLPSQATGSGGNLRINTGQLTVRDGAEASVNSIYSGAAGKLEITAHSILLDNQGKLSAGTASGEGGDITLQTSNLLLLRGNSKISTTAGGSGNGGNATINAGILASLDNSDIVANALNGSGGNIKIKTQGTVLPADSDITASSQKGINGTVQINTLVNNPSQGLVILPIKPVNITGQIAQGCPAGVGPRASKFVVTGRGGLPPDPTETLRSEPTLADLGTTVQSQENCTSTTSNNPTSSEPAPLVEAQGWVTNAKGEVELVAQAPTATFHIPWLAPTICQATKIAS